MKRSQAELIDPREHGQRALALRKPVFDEAAVARAEDAVQAMSGSFPAWIAGDISKLQELRCAADLAQWSDASQNDLHTVAHDLKGLGATYGYPIVSEIAALLCRLIESDSGKAMTRHHPALARAHVDALRASVRADVKDADHPVGRALLQELEARVSALT
jgi:hypothetical protein